MSDREAVDGMDVESVVRAMLCDEVDDLREECRLDGTLEQLETILRDAARGLPISDRLGSIGLAVDRGRGYVPIPGARGGSAASAWYGCPLPTTCPRHEVAGPGEVPRCHLSDQRMNRLEPEAGR